MKHKGNWYDISRETSMRYGVYDRLYSAARKSIELISEDESLSSNFEIKQRNFEELMDEDIIFEIAVQAMVKNVYYLMLRDKPVLYFNLEDFIVEVLDKSLLPYGLRGVSFQTTNNRELLSNIKEIEYYFSNRVLSLHRKNAKQILNLLKLSQSNNTDIRCSIALYCKGLTLTDSYWVKKEGSNDTWNNVNLFNNHLDEALIDVSLMGISYTPTTTCTSPELTTKGLFKKLGLEMIKIYIFINQTIWIVNGIQGVKR